MVEQAQLKTKIFHISSGRAIRALGVGDATARQHAHGNDSSTTHFLGACNTNILNAILHMMHIIHNKSIETRRSSVLSTFC